MSAIISIELPLWKPTTQATSSSTANTGGAVNSGSAEVLGSTIGELTYVMPASGSDQTQYFKWFIKNINSATDLTSGLVWQVTALNQMTGGATAVTLTPSSSADGSQINAVILGANVSNTPISDTIGLNGLTPVTGSNANFTRIDRVELRNASTGALYVAGASGPILIHANQDLGYVPGPMNGAHGKIVFYTATAEIKIALATALDDTTTIATPSTAPASTSSFVIAKDLGSAVAMANSGTLTYGHVQGGWGQWTLKANANASPDVQFYLMIQGQT